MDNISHFALSSDNEPGSGGPALLLLIPGSSHLIPAAEMDL